MRLIDADALVGKCEFYETEMEVKNAPTVCDIAQISSARYNNGFYDGKKSMEEKIEQIRTEIEQEYSKFRNMSDKWDERANGIGTALEIIDRYTKGASK